MEAVDDGGILYAKIAYRSHLKDGASPYTSSYDILVVIHG
jgi:hypothetical protein